EPEVVSAENGVPAKGLWVKIAKQIRRRPRLIWVATSLILIVGAFGATQLDAVGVPQSDLVLGSSEARDGQAVLGEHFPGGSGSPVFVVVPESSLQDAASVLLANQGIDSVSISSADSPSGSATVTEGEMVAFGPAGTAAAAPTVVR